MRKYEVMVLIDSDVDERQAPALVDKHLEVITKGGGSIENIDIWGRRRLAYDINKKSEAIYAVVQLTAEPATVSEMDRLMSIDERIVRTNRYPEMPLDAWFRRQPSTVRAVRDVQYATRGCDPPATVFRK